MADVEGLWAPLFQWVQSLPAFLEFMLVAALIILALSISVIALSNSLQIKAMWRLISRRATDESPHLTCPYRDDGEAYAYATREYEVARSTGAAELLRRQMDNLGQILASMSGEMRSTHITLMAEMSDSSDPVRSQECRHFALVLKIFQNEMENVGRGYFKKNGFAHMSDQEFFVYKSGKSVALKFLGTEIIDMYYDGVVVTREKLYEANKALHTKILQGIGEAFDYARAEAIAYHKDLDAKKRAYDYYHQRFHKRWSKEMAKC